MKNSVIYVRTSTGLQDPQEEQEAKNYQEMLCRTYCEKNKMGVQKVIVEENVRQMGSGVLGNLERIKESAKGNVLVISTIDRLSRDGETAYQILRYFLDAGIPLHVANGVGEIDLQNQECRTFLLGALYNVVLKVRR